MRGQPNTPVSHWLRDMDGCRRVEAVVAYQICPNIGKSFSVVSSEGSAETNSPQSEQASQNHKCETIPRPVRSSLKDSARSTTSLATQSGGNQANLSKGDLSSLDLTSEVSDLSEGSERLRPFEAFKPYGTGSGEELRQSQSECNLSGLPDDETLQGSHPAKSSKEVRRETRELPRACSTSVTTFGAARPTSLDAEFRWRFQYSEETTVVSHFNCALQGKILLQGKMYVTTKAIGFYSAFNDSNLFFSTIPTLVLFEYDELVSVKKKNNLMIFPNSLEFELKSGEKYFFTSFVRREKCYAVISHLTQHRFCVEPPTSLEDDPFISERARSILLRTGSALEPGPSEIGSPRKAVAADKPPACLPYQHGFKHSHPVAIFRNIRLFEIFKIFRDAKELYDLYARVVGNFDLEISDWEDACPGLNSATSMDALISSPPHGSPSSNSSKGVACPYRDIKYKKKVSPHPIVPMPPFASLSERQELEIHESGSSFSLKSKCNVKGPPFCDYFYFSTEMRFSQVGEDVQHDCYLSMVWTKSTILSGKIESHSIADWKQNVEVWRTVVGRALRGTKAEGSEVMTIEELPPPSPPAKVRNSWLAAVFQPATLLKNPTDGSEPMNEPTDVLSRSNPGSVVTVLLQGIIQLLQTYMVQLLVFLIAWKTLDVIRIIMT